MAEDGSEFSEKNERPSAPGPASGYRTAWLLFPLAAALFLVIVPTIAMTPPKRRI